MLKDARTEELIEDRGSVYGLDPLPGFRTTGRIWSALISDALGIDLPDIPPHVVGLMMTGLKLSRAARPTEKRDRDSYEDGVVYLNLAAGMDPTLPKETNDDATTRA